MVRSVLAALRALHLSLAADGRQRALGPEAMVRGVVVAYAEPPQSAPRCSWGRLSRRATPDAASRATHPPVPPRRGRAAYAATPAHPPRASPPPPPPPRALAA
eukprot:7297718-Prymnesium_polylepis.1